jgi:gas vesicle protein
MGQDTEGLTTTPADIDATRANLSRDIDELTDKVSPSRVVERRKQAARGRIGAIRDKMMGSSPTIGSGGNGPGVGSRISDTAGSVSDSAGGAVDAIGSKAQGNPLAAGLVAFGAGMLISALIPASQKEAEVAQRAVDAAKEHGQPVLDEAKSVGQQMGQELKDSAAESAQQVKETAQDSVENVKQEGQSSAQTVKEQASPS